MKIGFGKVVTLEYSARWETGELVESTEASGPISYVHGATHPFPALQRHLEGMRIGQEQEVCLSPADAYGERDPTLIKSLARDRLPPALTLRVGQSYTLKTRKGQKLHFSICEIRGEEILVDFNRPRTGRSLVVKAKVVGIREATPQEQAQGLAGPGSLSSTEPH